MHIYTDKLGIPESFSAIQEGAVRLDIKEIHFNNLNPTEEECIEWHEIYEDKVMNEWKFDVIHIHRGSKHNGTIERVTNANIKR